MKEVLDRIEANLAGLQSWAETGEPLPFIDEGVDFVVGPPMEEAELHAIECKYELELPPEYRAFLTRFGDTSVGPGHVFRRVNEGLTAQSKNRFPLSKPLLGTLSPEHLHIPQLQEEEDAVRLFKLWEPIPKESGVLELCDYGCLIYGVLILSGPYRDQVWIRTGDSAYYGPFGGFEPLHDESRLQDWKVSEHPREYSFLEWYESWLNVRLKMAGLVPW
jgi:hypothetical protein